MDNTLKEIKELLVSNNKSLLETAFLFDISIRNIEANLYAMRQLLSSEDQRKIKELIQENKKAFISAYKDTYLIEKYKEQIENSFK